MTADVILGQLALADTRQGWSRYIEYLTSLADDPDEQMRQQFDTLDRGWAIGTNGWKQALARRFSHLARQPGMAADEVRELKENRWRTALHAALQQHGRSEADLQSAAASPPWKIEIAALLRRRVAAPYAWIARELRLGNLTTLRSSVRRLEMHHASA